MSDSFYQRIKKWITLDYYNPGIKAEVLLDMLISEDICDILQRSIPKWKGQKKVLLAKEFPIDNDERDASRRNRKVDYLLVDEKSKDLIFVELKTTKDSFEQGQFHNYLRFCGKRAGDPPAGIGSEEIAKDLFGFYQQVCKEIYPGDIEKAGQKALRMKSTKKYAFQLLRMMKEYPPEGSIQNPDFVREYIANTLRQRFSDYRISLVYLSIEPMDLHQEIDENPEKYENAETLKRYVYNICMKKPDDKSGDGSKSFYLFNDSENEIRWKELKGIVDEIIHYKEVADIV